MRPHIVVENELAISIDVVSWNFNIPFGSEIKTFDVDGAKKGVDVISDVRTVVFRKGVGNIFNEDLCGVSLPDGFDYIQDVRFITCFKAFYRKEEVWAGGCSSAMWKVIVGEDQMPCCMRGLISSLDRL